MTTNTTKQSLPFEDAFFHKKDFWDEHYKTNSQRDSDWYMTYEHLAPILHPILQKNHKILVIGCGESGFGPTWWMSLKIDLDTKLIFFLLRIKFQIVR
jgi:hypothetical protein